MSDIEEPILKLKFITDQADMFKGKYLKKYMFSIGAMLLGLFVGGAITPGIFAGIFSAAAFGLSIERLREASGETYNWVLAHPGSMEVLTTIVFTGVFGLTATGIVGSLVSNILTSVILDYYAEKEGPVPGLQPLSFIVLLRKLIDGIKKIIKNLRDEFRDKPVEEKALVIEFIEAQSCAA